jgi:hypothetical protein
MPNPSRAFTLALKRLVPVLACLAFAIVLIPGVAAARTHHHAAAHHHHRHAGARSVRRKHAHSARNSLYKHHGAGSTTGSGSTGSESTSSGSTGSGSTPPVTAPTETTPTETTPSVTTPPDGGSNLAPSASVKCDLFAAPSGSDTTGDGSVTNPYQSVVKLDDALAPGQTGCLSGGTYGSTATEMKLAKSGNASGQITIRNVPGQHALVRGFINVTGAYVTLSHLDIDDSNTFFKGPRNDPTSSCIPPPVSEPLMLSSVGDVLEYNNIYQSVASLRAVMIAIGWDGTPNNAIVRYNKLHDSGACDNYDHTIYIASGSNVEIYGNWIWNNRGGQAISLYGQPRNDRIYSNVIDTSDSGIAIGYSSADNLIFNNVVSNSGTVVNYDAGFSFSGVLINCAGLSGTANQVYANDSYNNPGGASNGACNDLTNITMTNTTTANPLFVNSASNNYSLQPGSPVASFGLWNGIDPSP